MIAKNDISLKYMGGYKGKNFCRVGKIIINCKVNRWQQLLNRTILTSSNRKGALKCQY